MRASSIQLKAKKTHYGVDGTGRDSYINFDNGGNYRGYMQEGRGKFQLGTFGDVAVNKKKSYTGIEGRPLHYVGDGTGRDFYVISNEGGIADRGTNKKFNFLASLRAPIKRHEVKKDDVFMNTNDSWKSKHSKDSNPFCTYQRNLNQRLSEPKKAEDPYDKMRTSFRSSVGFNSKRN